MNSGEVRVLSTEQQRRAVCLELAVLLLGSRGGVSWQSLMSVAEWLYRGEAVS